MSAIRDLLDDLTPLHEAMARFRRGGEQCAAQIETIYDALVETLREFNELTEEVEALRIELDEREAADEAASP
jgi:hypothetical protein